MWYLLCHNFKILSMRSHRFISGIYSNHCEISLLPYFGETINFCFVCGKTVLVVIASITMVYLHITLNLRLKTQKFCQGWVRTNGSFKRSIQVSVLL